MFHTGYWFSIFCQNIYLDHDLNEYCLPVGDHFGLVWGSQLVMKKQLITMQIRIAANEIRV